MVLIPSLSVQQAQCIDSGIGMYVRARSRMNFFPEGGYIALYTVAIYQGSYETAQCRLFSAFLKISHWDYRKRGEDKREKQKKTKEFVQ